MQNKQICKLGILAQHHSMTAAQSTKKAINQRATVTLNLIQGLNQRAPRRLGFNPTPPHAAFSLVEMLMALLVASLLLAALAPVMTKKMSENINVNGISGGGHAPAVFKCWDYDSPELQPAADGSNYKVLPEAYPVDDAWNINFILASGGGGGAGATIPNETSHSFDGTGELKIEPEMDEIDIVSMIGGGAGGGGGAAVFSSATCTGGPSEAKCECMGATYDSVNKVCVSNNLGSKNLTNAKTACQNVTPLNKWSLPTTSQLSNWKTNTLYSTLGIISGQTVWSQTSGQGACSSSTSTYNCYYNGAYRTGYASETECCSGSSYGSKKGAYEPNNNSCGVYCAARNVTSSPGSGWFKGDGQTATKCGGTGGCNWGSTDYFKCGTCPDSDTCASTVTTSCSSYYTNYYFYQLTGSTWSQSYATDNTGSRQTYCVYNDSANVTGESFYSLSGGGGGGAPAISDNNFDSNILNTFRKRVKENAGGYLEFQRGTGGNGGDASASKNQKAGNGADGGDTCIIVKNAARAYKYKLCVSGGNGGGGANATKADSSTTGWGYAGGEKNNANACYVVDYTANSAGVKTDFDCALKGKAGGAGGASTSNPTAGGKGAASVLNSTQVGGTAVKDGVSASTSNYGAGGGGGSASKTGYGSSATLAFGKGGNGAPGYIKINYKKKFAAAGGGGGGGGYVAHINNITVGKTATCEIKVGYGGAGGAAGIKGYDGGDSSVTCSNAPNVTYRITGGKGGELGSTTAGGLGGEAGTYDDTGNIFTRLFSQGNFRQAAGLAGKQGGAGDSANFKANVRSAGGRGGTGGTGEKGKCGGIYTESGVCATVQADENNDITEPNQDALNGEGFGAGEITAPTKDGIVEATPKYGKAGAGGGGGAWYVGKNPGRGGAGQGGYVCIYWDKLE